MRPPQRPYGTPGLQIYLRPRVTLTFDLLTPKVDSFMSLWTEYLCHLASNSFEHIVFTSLVTDERTDGRTNGQVENISLCLPFYPG